MADVHYGSAPEASPAREGQRTSRTVPPGEDRGQKGVAPDVAKGQKPAKDGSKAAPAVPPTMPPAPPLPRPKKKEE